MIRSGHSKAVGLGTVVRLSANLVVLSIGYFSGSFPGIVVGASAVAAGVISEAFFAGLVVRPVLHNELRLQPAVEPALTWHAFSLFYFPLVMTSLLSLLANPIGSAALSRMPLALESLAVWPVVTGLIFILRSLGIAYNEVVVALLDQCGAYPYLKRFANLLAALTTAFLLLVTATPLSHLWFQGISALRPDLAELAQHALWFALPLPALSVLQSWYQGAILYGKRTNGITESVVIYLVTSLVVLGAGVISKNITGLNVGLLALTLSVATQTAWLWYRSLPVRQALDRRDQEENTHECDRDRLAKVARSVLLSAPHGPAGGGDSSPRKARSSTSSPPAGMSWPRCCWPRLWTIPTMPPRSIIARGPSCWPPA